MDTPAPSTATPAVADPAAAVHAEIATLRTAPYGVGESQLDRAEKFTALYKRLHELPPAPSVPTAKPADDDGHAAPDPVASVPPLEVPPVPMELAGEHAYDRDALAELGPALAGAGLAKDDVTMWIKVGSDSLTEREHRTAEQCYAELDKRFGEEKADAMMADAIAMLDRLSKPTREAVHRWLDATGLANHPSFVEWLAGHGAKLRAGGKS